MNWKEGKMMKKGIFSTKIALLIVMILITACGTKEENSDENKEKESSSNKEYVIGKEDITYHNDVDFVYEATEAMEENSAYIYTDGEVTEVNEARYEVGLELETGNSAYFDPVSTFSVDVDTASYSMVRNSLKNYYLPNANDIRIEEMINYFNYDYKAPEEVPFSITTEVAPCPWNNEYVIASIGLNGKEIDMDNRSLTNIVFLMDVSGSMNDVDKLPLLKESFKLLVDNLGENDRVSIVVYAGASGTVLDGARGDQKNLILEAIDNLEAGGSTAGSDGIQEAYRLAKKYFIRNGNNRVILATDGDFNVGLTNENDLLELIEEKREDGIFLSCLGFGSGGRDFDTMELLADNGNGHFAYIDSEREARRVMIEEIGGTLYTIAKDVKIQVEFNPAVVKEYNLIGYENRVLENYEFNDDSVDAGDIGAGHQVTALYLIKLIDYGLGEGEELRYNEEREGNTDEMMYVKLRYKEPNEEESQLISVVVENKIEVNPSNNFNFTTAVAEFGLALRGDFNYSVDNFNKLYDDTMNYVLEDPDAYKIEFVELISLAKMVLD